MIPAKLMAARNSLPFSVIMTIMLLTDCTGMYVSRGLALLVTDIIAAMTYFIILRNSKTVSNMKVKD